jgi:hypothetical protein
MKRKLLRYPNNMFRILTTCKTRLTSPGRIIFLARIAFFLSPAFMGCQSHQDNSPSNNSVPSIPVGINDVQMGVASAYLSDYEIVPLETNDSSLIKYIDKLVLFRERMYVLDCSQNTVLIFSKKGKFVTKISRIGKGPGEYEQIMDFCIDSLENKIIVHSDRPYKIMYFNMEGKFIDEHKMDGWYQNILATGENLVLYNRSSSPKEKFKIIFQSKTGKKKNMFLPYQGKINRCNIGYPNICQSNATYFYEPLNDTIYRINESNVVPAYYIDFGKDKLPENLRRSTDYREIDREVISTNKYGYFISNFRETEKYIIFKYEPARVVFYAKAEKKTVVFSSISEKRSGLGVNYFAHDGKGNKFVSILSADRFSRLMSRTEDIFYRTYPDFRKIQTKYKHVKVDDNPLIVFYTLK